MENVRENVGGYIALDWHDGPLLEIARVDFPDHDRMVQVQSLCTVHAEDTLPTGGPRAIVSGREPWTRCVIRLTRTDLQAMVDLLDGKPVKGFHDE